MSNLTITVTGYFSTGSSAVYDFLREYRTVTTGVFDREDFEHILLYMPDGLFDLEDKLLIGNNIHRSDEALNSFYQAMNDLYRNNYQWYGNYKEWLGDGFMKAVRTTINSLTEFTSTSKWYYDDEMRFSAKHTAASILHRIKREKVNANFSENIVYRKKYDDDLTRYAFPSEEEFYAAGRKFITAYTDLSRGGSAGTLLLDHFILPHNLFRIPSYISGEELKVIVVDRDIRDVYADIMRRAEEDQVDPPIPYKAEEFVAFIKKVRRLERKAEAEDQILRLRYEDMFFNYEDTVRKIETFCNLSPEDHTESGKYFDPESGKKYMGLYKRTSKYKKEVQYLERELPELIFSK